jgi:hypothetical protein
MNPYFPLLMITGIGIGLRVQNKFNPKVKLTDEVFAELRKAAENHQFNKANRTAKQRDLDAKIHNQLDREILNPEECAKLVREL